MCFPIQALSPCTQCGAHNTKTRAPTEGRTPLIRAPVGFYAKVRLFKARFEGEAAIF